MARPKQKEQRGQLNLSIKEEIIKKMKNYSVKEKKSLSQITEELYISLLKDQKNFIENPEELMRKVRESIPLIEKMMEQKKKEEEKKN